MKALALCHNVTPVVEKGGAEEAEEGWGEKDEEQVIFSRDDILESSIAYQASSPDEVIHCFDIHDYTFCSSLLNTHV